MTGWSILVNICVAAIGLAGAFLGFVLAVLTRNTDRYNSRFFTLFFSLLSCYFLTSLLDSVFIDYLGMAYTWPFQVNIFLESALTPLLLLLIVRFFLHCVNESPKGSGLFRVEMALWLIYMAMLVSTHLTGWLYFFTPEGAYQRGPWYPLLLMPPIASVAVCLAALIQKKAVLSRRQRFAFSFYYVMPLLSMLINIFNGQLRNILFGTMIASMCLFITILIDQREKNLRQAEENARQRASIAVLEMRPHFIYNTMMSIYYLCAQDTEKAQQVILNFTTYLRKNFTAIAKEELIPFSDEVEHTKAYLAAEQARFEGMLFVEFDTPCTAFRLPPLTLQPIVENAIKHGLDPELNPLYLTVTTRETANEIKISVEDTGPGFSDADDEEPHIALANIRERLSMMCRGSLVIAPRREGGTQVTIRLPKRWNEQSKHGLERPNGKKTR